MGFNEDRKPAVLGRFRVFWLLLLRISVFLSCGVCFFYLYGTKYAFLLRPSRTAGVIAVCFTVIYVLMTKIYGGLDVGKRKSKPIIFFHSSDAAV